ncbi:MAG: leucine-rich repeat domain-containing protein [Ferruginibacter sp.]
MILKITIFIFLMGSVKWLYSSGNAKVIAAETPINKAWWDALSEEWKSILLINQNFSKQGSDIYKVQEEYINRIKSGNEDDYSEMNTSLHDLFERKKFLLGYPDFYARALRNKHVIKNDHIDLSTLGDLDRIYMVNGPGDLTPLKKFPNLKTLILTDCGIDNTVPVKSQLLDLEPLRLLKKLQVLHCSSNALRSIEPIKDLVELQELRLDNSGITDISFLKKLVNLELLSVGRMVKNASVITGLINLKSLYLRGFKQIPDLSNLKKLKRLMVEENEMSIIDGSYCMKSIEFLKDLQNLEYLDLENTSYKGNLALLDSFQNLKAITLPPVNSDAMLEFKKHHSDCIIIDAYRYD